MRMRLMIYVTITTHLQDRKRDSMELISTQAHIDKLNRLIMDDNGIESNKNMEQERIERRKRIQQKSDNPKMLRVICLYRVSTKKQVGKDDDLPVQKRQCREFIALHPHWIIVDERYEKGVSAYKKPFGKRDVLKELLEDAKEKYYDILVYVANDRIGRRGNETTWVMGQFCKAGIQLWSVLEGHIDIDDTATELVTGITNWTSKNDSFKAAWRISNTHRQYAEIGKYRGGVTPYGFETEWTGEFTKKGVPVKKLIVKQDEADVVKKMFDLAYTKGWGASRIREYLVNETNTRTKNGLIWTKASINSILKNSLYKGIASYNKTKRSKNNEYQVNPKEDWVYSSVKNEVLAIIPDDVWDYVNEMRTARNNVNGKKYNFSYGVKSPLLFAGGIARCGYCGGKLTTSYATAKWTAKNKTTGQIEKRTSAKPIYRCNRKLDRNRDPTGEILCNGPTTYAQDKIEIKAIEFVYEHVKALREISLGKNILGQKSIEKEEQFNKYKEKDTKLKKLLLDSTNLEIEIQNILNGKGMFSHTKIQNMLEKKDIEIDIVQTELIELKKKISQHKTEELNTRQVIKELCGWEEIFEASDIDERRTMVSKLIESIIVFQDHIAVNFRIKIHEYEYER